MSESGTIIWKEKIVGRATIVSNDMWYVDAEWISNKSEDAKEFEQLSNNLESFDVLKNPTKEFIVKLKYDDSATTPGKFLVLGLDGSKLYMRMIFDEIAISADTSDRLQKKPWWKLW
jgi:hypothetical protein